MPRRGKKIGAGRPETEADINLIIGQICHGKLVQAMYGAVENRSPKIIREAQKTAFSAWGSAKAKKPRDAARFKEFSPDSNDHKSARASLEADVDATLSNAAALIEKTGRVHQVRRAPNGARARAIAETKADIFKLFRRSISTDKVLNSLKVYRRSLSRV